MKIHIVRDVRRGCASRPIISTVTCNLNVLTRTKMRNFPPSRCFAKGRERVAVLCSPVRRRVPALKTWEVFLCRLYYGCNYLGLMPAFVHAPSYLLFLSSSLLSLSASHVLFYHSVIRSSKPLPFRSGIIVSRYSTTIVRSVLYAPRNLLCSRQKTSSDLSKVNDAWKFQQCAG